MPAQLALVSFLYGAAYGLLKIAWIVVSAVFLYDVEGQHRALPLLTQVLKQTNAHVGLVFAPDGQTLYAAVNGQNRVVAIDPDVDAALQESEE